ncbi:putative chromatin remodelling complex SNF2H [Cryptosporidium serpentis]
MDEVSQNKEVIKKTMEINISNGTDNLNRITTFDNNRNLSTSDDEMTLDSSVLNNLSSASIIPLSTTNNSCPYNQDELDIKLKTLLDATNAYSCLLSGDETLAMSISEKVNTSGKGRHHIMSEKEEDDLLIREAQKDEKIGTNELEENALFKAPEKITEQPNCIMGRMKDYQLEGLNWLYQLYKYKINGILADEMGLGKTLQSISILGYLKNICKVQGPHIILTPRSTLDNWHYELRRWCPSLRVVKLHGDKLHRDSIFNHRIFPGYKVLMKSNFKKYETFDLKKENTEYNSTKNTNKFKPDSTENQETFRRIDENEILEDQIHCDDKSFNVCLTTFEMAIKERWRLQRIDWHYLILDEAHRIKNEKSILSEVVRLLKSKYRLLITGTPLQNNLKELWSLLNFLMPSLFSSSEDFEALFDFSRLDSDEQQKRVIQILHSILRPFMLRRLKTDVERELPPKRELYVYIGLSKLQKKIYSELLTRNLDILNSVTSNKTQMLNLLMQLRKACNHPYLFDGVEPGPPYVEGLHMVEASGKMVLLHKLLPKLFSQGSRVLLFSQMTRLLDIIDDYLRWCGYPYCRIDGSTPGIERQERIDLFNKNKSDKLIFLLSTRAGGIGINLATADVVILFDSDFNPQMDLQAMDRAHRIGQKKTVTVYRFVTEKSVEERIVERAAKKLKLDSLIIQQNRLSNSASHAAPDNKELHEMIQFGAQEVYHTRDSSSVTDEDIDTILAAAQERTNEMNKKMKSLYSELNLQNLRLDGGIKTATHPDDTNTEKEKSEGKISTNELTLSLNEMPWFDLGERKTKWKLESKSSDQNPAKKKNKKVKLTGWRAAVGGGHDFQFFNNKRLDNLESIEEEWEQYKKLIGQETENIDKTIIEKPEKNRQDDIFAVPPELKELNENQLLRLLNVAEEHMKVSIDKVGWSKKKLYSRCKELYGAQFILPRCNFNEAIDELRKMFNDGRAWDINIPCARQKKAKNRKYREFSDTKSDANKTRPREFTKSMSMERDTLLGEGFREWNRNDFQRFCKAAELCGSNILGITEILGNKSFEDVERYFNTFIKRYNEVQNGSKVFARIKMVDESQRWLSDAQEAINYVVFEHLKKIKSRHLSFDNLFLPFKLKNYANTEYFTAEEDIALFLGLYKYGIESYNNVAISFKYLTKPLTSTNKLYSAYHSIDSIINRCSDLAKSAIAYMRKNQVAEIPQRSNKNTPKHKQIQNEKQSTKKAEYDDDDDDDNYSNASLDENEESDDYEQYEQSSYTKKSRNSKRKRKNW